MPAESSPPLNRPSGRATNPWQHRWEARRNFATSKDVMPAQAGYTSGSLVFCVNHELGVDHV
jgi:hypothetical protein